LRLFAAISSFGLGFIGSPSFRLAKSGEIGYRTYFFKIKRILAYFLGHAQAGKPIQLDKTDRSD
jgi:hypothetical protein